MKVERIEFLVQLLPLDMPFMGRCLNPNHRTPGSYQQLRRDRRQRALNDPGFGFKFVRAFIDAGHTRLPAPVTDKVLVKAFDAEVGNAWHRHVEDAICLRHMLNRFEVHCLESFLLLQELSYEQIGMELGIAPQTVRIYEELFFNVRDRQREKAYISKQAWPEHRLVELADDYLKAESSRMIMLRTAHEQIYQNVRWIAGLPSTAISEMDSALAAKRLESRQMSTANVLSTAGGLHGELAVIRRSNTLIGAQKASGQDAVIDADTKGIGAVGAHYSMLNTAARVAGHDRELRAKQILAKSNAIAANAEKKQLAEKT